MKRVVDAFWTAATRWRLRRIGVTYGVKLRAIGRMSVRRHPGSTLEVGARFLGVSSSRRQILGLGHELVLRTASPGARIVIGDDCGMSGASVVAYCSIVIGNGCLIGADAMIVDSDFHPIHSLERRYAPVPEPLPEHRITIGDNAFIGARAVVLKGVTIGENAVVGAGAVVVHDVAPGAIVAGNPAAVVGWVRS